MWSTIVIILSSFIIAALAVGGLARGAAARIALDTPNERSLHTAPVPRTGGIGLLLGVAGGWAIVGAGFSWPFWCALALLIGVSMADDLLKRGVSAAIRFLMQLIAAALAVSTLQSAHGTLLFWVLSVFAIGWMCNLYNFMDGSDGLAGGMALFGFLAYAIAAWLADQPSFALLNLAIAAAAAGFLMHNLHPACIFLGDAGSVPLGFLAAFFGLSGYLDNIWAWWFPLLVFSPFIVDASVTLLRRACAGNAVWRAHRDHYYQRLVQLGWGHRRTAYAEFVLMGICAAVALLALRASAHAQWLILAGTALIYSTLIVIISVAWRKAPLAQKHDA